MKKEEITAAFTGGDQNPVVMATREIFQGFREDLVKRVTDAESNEELRELKGQFLNLEMLEIELKAQIERANLGVEKGGI